jgi:hypothetical protein
VGLREGEVRAAVLRMDRLSASVSGRRTPQARRPRRDGPFKDTVPAAMRLPAPITARRTHSS